MTNSTEIHACAVCGRVLDHHSNLGWAHTLQDRRKEDHVAVPVPASALQIRGRCDFCNADDPTWAVPCRTFTVIPGHPLQGDWAACDTCVTYVNQGDWDGLSRHAAPSPDHVGILQVLYVALAANITGRPTPITRPAG